jgi:hypothetical protein
MSDTKESLAKMEKYHRNTLRIVRTDTFKHAGYLQQQGVRHMQDYMVHTAIVIKVKTEVCKNPNMTIDDMVRMLEEEGEKQKEGGTAMLQEARQRHKQLLSEEDIPTSDEDEDEEEEEEGGRRTAAASTAEPFAVFDGITYIEA